MSPSCFRGRQHAPRTHTSATAITAGFKLPLLELIKRLLDWRPVDLVKPSRLGLLAGVALLGALSASPAFAADPSHVTFTLEGCRNTGSIIFPPGGPFVCPDGAYTTGNLGKGWNELDLVPHRLTADAGNSAPASQIYTVAVVADNEDGTPPHPGYDVISTLTKNTALSSGSCPAPVVGPQLTASPGLGGISKSIYRLVTITQLKNTTCVYDYHERLALGSHLFPGSSLHSNLALPTNGSITTSGIGARDVSIPVKEILPQELSKDMSAAQGGDHAWNLTKLANPANVSFGDVCLRDAPQPQPVTLTVTWTKLALTPGEILVTTEVFATNPAARIITVNVSDQIYQGKTQTTPLGAPATSGPVDVAANSTQLVLTHTATLPASDGSIGDFLNDVATATYTDKVTGVPVPGQTTAKDEAQIEAGAVTNTTAVITDSESITGSGLKFSVATPAVGNFTNYAAGTQTVGPVDWSSGVQSGSGSVSFDKTVYLDSKQITNGVLTDTANLVASPGGFTTSFGPVDVNITSAASVNLTIQKTIPGFLGAGERIEIAFHISRATDPTFSRDEVITFTGDSPLVTTKHVDLTGLVPDTYIVDEGTATFFPVGGPGEVIGLTDPSGTQRSVDLNVTPTAANCSGTASYNNVPSAGPARAQVQKITDPPLLPSDPDYLWVFTLTGGDLPPAGIQATAGAGAGFVVFDTPPLAEGTYTVTETLKSGWDLNSALPNDGVITTICTFTVNYPQDSDSLKSCTFTNTKRGKAQVIKTQSGAPLSGTQTFTFQLRQGASSTQAGTILETQTADAANLGTFTFTTLLVPGTHYQLCELVLPGWQTSLSSAFTVFNPDGDNSVLCTDFTVAAGETKPFAIDNIPPPGGQARTIGFWKNWASCKQSNGKQDPVLDQTLALATPPGVQVGTLFLTGSSSDVCEAVSILNKSDVVTGKKLASNPLYGLAAQLLAAELNIVAGATTCPAVNNAITQANALLVKYGFNGSGTYSLTKADATLANSLAKKLDDYNNNLPSACL